MWAHEVGRACVDAQVVAVGVLLVRDAADEARERRQHEAAQLAGNVHVAHARGHEDLLERAAHALADGGDVVGRLLRPVGHAHAARQVHEAHAHAALALDAHGEAEQQPRERREVLVGHGVAGEKSVDSQLADASARQLARGLEHLGLGEAELGALRRVEDAVGEREVAARVEAQAHEGGELPHGTLPGVDVGDVVEVDARAQARGVGELGVGRVVGGEHDLVSPKAQRLGEHELALAGAVEAEAVLAQDGEDGGVGRGLDGEVLLEAGAPREGVDELLGPLADAALVVEVERGRVLGADGLELVEADERSLLLGHGTSPPSHAGMVSEPLG